MTHTEMAKSVSVAVMYRIKRHCLQQTHIYCTHTITNKYYDDNHDDT